MIGGLGQFQPVLISQETRSKLFGIDLRLETEQPHTKLQFRHFQRKNDDRLARFLCGMVADVQGKGRLAHTGPARNDDQIRGLKARRQIVEVRVARGNTGQISILLRNAFKFPETPLDDVFHGAEAFANLVFRNIKDGLLRHIEEFVRLVPVLKAGFGYHGTLVDQSPAHGQIAHDLRVIEDTGRG